MEPRQRECQETENMERSSPRVECIRAKIKGEDADHPQILRVAPYCRVSTDTKEQEASYETQIRAYRKYISERPDWVLVDIYADKGISGTSLKHRERFQDMIRDCVDGKIDMIITKNISRFARNVVDCVTTARMLKSLTPPVGIFFEDVGINTATQTGELLLIVLAAIAQGESEIKSTSVKWGFQKRFEEGIPKIAPLYGYVLNSQGVPSPRKKRWVPSTVHALLSNEKYCGDVIMQKTVTVDMYAHKTIRNDGRAAMYMVRDYHPAIVSRETWERVQAILTSARGRADRSTWTYWIGENPDNDISGFDVIRFERKRGGETT